VGKHLQKGDEDDVKYLCCIHIVKIHVHGPQIVIYSVDLVAVFLCA